MRIELCPGPQQTATGMTKGSMNLQRRYGTAILHAGEVRRQCVLGSCAMTEANERLRRESAWEGAREDLCGGGRVSQSCAEGRDGVVASRRR